MSALSSASTAAEVRAAYMDNASYEEDGSATKAAAFITACRLLLLMMPKLINQGSAQLATSPDQIRAEMTRAQAWYATNAETSAGGNGSVRYADLRDFR